MLFSLLFVLLFWLLLFLLLFFYLVVLVFIIVVVVTFDIVVSDIVLVVVLIIVGPNLNLKFGQNRVGNSWDIADVEFPVGGGGWCKVIFMSNQLLLC